MNTPICDFVRDYSKKNNTRLHMPGHKGTPVLGFEAFDITEFDGADELFSPTGIIKESEKNASELFGAHTFYSTGGSTLSIQAMLKLFTLYAKAEGKAPCILAARNAHKAFINAAALLDIDVSWLYGDCNTYYSCKITPQELEKELTLQNDVPSAVYITSPDYLGSIADIKGISKVCKKHGALLLVDNAHGAYLKFLKSSLHPIDLGADMCCDSAHKTLPVLTGGAYLHINKNVPEILYKNAKSALALFSTSSPSYLILQSLDAVNPILSSYEKVLSDFIKKVDSLKSTLTSQGFDLFGEEPLKITIAPKGFGYTGHELAAALKKHGIFTEFHDPDFVVLMVTPYNDESDLAALKKALSGLEKMPTVKAVPPSPSRLTPSLKMREALFSQSERVPASQAIGKICAEAAVSCPPCVPIAVFGEIIDENAAKCFDYYEIKECAVIKEAVS